MRPLGTLITLLTKKTNVTEYNLATDLGGNGTTVIDGRRTFLRDCVFKSSRLESGVSIPLTARSTRFAPFSASSLIRALGEPRETVRARILEPRFSEQIR